MDPYIVCCRVSGGVTGTRESRLKDSTGLVQRFATRDDAQRKADHLNTEMNNRYSVANFQYWVEEDN
jgi:hypothetical protein